MERTVNQLQKKVKKQDVNFLSANQINTVHGFVFTCEDVKAKAIIQISHGMCEYIARYTEFAEFMAQNGYIVCGNDHLGHGQTSSDNGMDGYFSPKNGADHVLQDLNTFNRIVKEMHPNLDVILLGHSMGSFFARKYAAVFPQSIKALILSGTAGPNPLAGVGIALTRILSIIKGDTYRSAFVDKLSFGSYCSQIENSTSKYDWVTGDKEILEKYKKDAKCTFLFTVSAFHDMMTVMKQVNSKTFADKYNKDTPVYIFAGDKDPVGDYFKGVQLVHDRFKQVGIKDITLKKYQGGLHEMLNAPNRQQVYTDLLSWVDKYYK